MSIQCTWICCWFLRYSKHRCEFFTCTCTSVEICSLLKSSLENQCKTNHWSIKDLICNFRITLNYFFSLNVIVFFLIKYHGEHRAIKHSYFIYSFKLNCTSYLKALMLDIALCLFILYRGQLQGRRYSVSYHAILNAIKKIPQTISKNGK